MRKLIFIVVLTLLVLGFKGCGHEKDINQALDAVGIPSSAAEFKHNYKTPAGIEVKSVVDLPPHALFAIDQGILIQIDRLDHLRPMWNNYKDIRQYKVLVVEPGAYSTVDLPGAPLLMLRDGVTTAGTVIGIGGTAYEGGELQRPIDGYDMPNERDDTRYRCAIVARNCAPYESKGRRPDIHSGNGGG